MFTKAVALANKIYYPKGLPRIGIYGKDLWIEPFTLSYLHKALQQFNIERVVKIQDKYFKRENDFDKWVSKYSVRCGEGVTLSGLIVFPLKNNAKVCIGRETSLHNVNMNPFDFRCEGKLAVDIGDHCTVRDVAFHNHHGEDIYNEGEYTTSVDDYSELYSGLLKGGTRIGKFCKLHGIGEFLEKTRINDNVTIDFDLISSGLWDRHRLMFAGIEVMSGVDIKVWHKSVMAVTQYDGLGTKIGPVILPADTDLSGDRSGNEFRRALAGDKESIKRLLDPLGLSALRKY